MHAVGRFRGQTQLMLRVTTTTTVAVTAAPAAPAVPAIFTAAKAITTAATSCSGTTTGVIPFVGTTAFRHSPGHHFRSVLVGASSTSGGLPLTWHRRLHLHNIMSKATRGERDYPAAIRALNELQSNASVLAAQQQTEGKLVPQAQLKHQHAALKRLGITDEDLLAMHAVHITGSKGKGSTAAMVESILRQHGLKTGLFTSPHLIEARERIRINGKPIVRPMFAQHFFTVLDRLFDPELPPLRPVPAYFRFLTLVALEVFKREQVDVAVVEVGIGGRYDGTNVLVSPAACGVSTIALEHTDVLGHTVDAIAYQKGGIFKSGSPCFTVPQHPSAMAQLRKCAREQGASSFGVVPSGGIDAHLGAEEAQDKTVEAAATATVSSESVIKLGLDGRHQASNAALAVQLAAAALRATGHPSAPQTSSGASIPLVASSSSSSVETQRLPPPPKIAKSSMTEVVEPKKEKAEEEEEVCSGGEGEWENEALPAFALSAQFRTALETCRWPGRSQQERYGKLHLYLDGAHTSESCAAAAVWFADAITSISASTPEGTQPPAFGILFNSTGRRSAESLLRPLTGLVRNSSLRSSNRIVDTGSSLSLSSSAAAATTTSATAAAAATAAATANMMGNAEFVCAAFCSNLVSATPGQQPSDMISLVEARDDMMRRPLDNHAVWKSLLRAEGLEAEAECAAAYESIEMAIAAMQKAAKEVRPDSDAPLHLFITGSLHLVGGTLSHIGAEVV